MKQNLPKLFIGAVFILISTSLFSQEKVHVVTDRDIYIGGEIMFASVACFQTQGNGYSGISKVVYFEILNSNKTPVYQSKLYTPHEATNTKIQLSDTLSTGQYIVRAYTRWMRNFDECHYFTKTISIFNPFAKNKFSGLEFTQEPIVAHIEGGALIPNTNNSIYFTVQNSVDRTELSDIKIMSPQGPLTPVALSNSGLSKTEYTPHSKGLYTVRFSYKGRNRELELGIAKHESYAIHLLESKDGYRFSIHTSKEDSEVGRFLISTTNGELVLDKPCIMSEGYSIFIPSSDMMEGIYCSLLLNEKQEVVSSRFFVNRKGKKSPVSVVCDKRKFGTRAEVKVDINKSNKVNDVTVKVVKSSLLFDVKRLSVQSFLGGLKYKDLDQFVESSNSVQDALALFQADNNFLASIDSFRYTPDCYGETIRGVVKDNETEDAMQNELMTLSFASSAPQLYVSCTNNKGQFEFESKSFGMKQMAIIPKQCDSLTKYLIELENPFSEKKQMSPLHYNYDSILIDDVNEAIVNMQIQSMYSSYQVGKDNEFDQGDSLAFYGVAKDVILPDKFISLMNLQEVFHEIVSTVSIRKRKGKYFFGIYDNDAVLFDVDNVLILLDGIPVFDVEQLLKLNPAELDRIEINSRDYYIGNKNIGKVLCLYSKDNDQAGYSFSPKYYRIAHQGLDFLHQPRPVTYPCQQTQKRIPDFRNTLYWEPNLKFDQNGKANVTFFTSDEETEYSIVVEYIDQAGLVQQEVIPFETHAESL